MVDLVQWLGAQLDTDAEKARTAQAERDGAWRYVETPGGDHRVLDSLGYSVVEDPPVESEPWFTLPHIAAWDPARVLREIEAKRLLLDDHPIVPRDVEPTVIDGEEIGGPYFPFGCGNCHAEPDSPEVNGFGYCFTVKVLALPYADRDGYQESWRP